MAYNELISIVSVLAKLKIDTKEEMNQINNSSSVSQTAVSSEKLSTEARSLDSLLLA